ncbi:hypothetical protein HPB51_028767 [Rhipicephalus microplus]|uniref:Uncharacterized protein n=1 Tax=Rhipicephalus microplus TaxID=6941 RepID=A0A9J6CW37_RHIMP|nr:hypothetical protein HPB51_028767 [Rhipicephalus microplus]
MRPLTQVVPSDGFIPLTHIIEDEFIGGYKECWISGWAPYRLAPHSNNTNVLGMEKTIEDINFIRWNGYPSLAVSVPMSTRVYKAKAALAPMDAPCVNCTWGVNTTLNFCEINKLYGNLDLGLALYDIDCKDLELGCLAPTAGIYETNRFGNVSQHTHKLVNYGVASACPWLVSPAEVPAATLGHT